MVMKKNTIKKEKKGRKTIISQALQQMGVGRAVHSTDDALLFRRRLYTGGNGPCVNNRNSHRQRRKGRKRSVKLQEKKDCPLTTLQLMGWLFVPLPDSLSLHDPAKDRCPAKR